MQPDAANSVSGVRGEADVWLLMGRKYTPKYISAIECGQRNITIKALAKIADGLGVEPFELLLFPDPPDPTIITRKAIDSLLKEADITVRLCLQFLKTAINA
jgi:transcriptional regulator with XRE-family HTH domain